MSFVTPQLDKHYCFCLCKKIVLHISRACVPFRAPDRCLYNTCGVHRLILTIFFYNSILYCMVQSLTLNVEFASGKAFGQMNSSDLAFPSQFLMVLNKQAHLFGLMRWLSGSSREPVSGSQHSIQINPNQL